MGLIPSIDWAMKWFMGIMGVVYCEAGADFLGLSAHKGLPP